MGSVPEYDTLIDQGPRSVDPADPALLDLSHGEERPSQRPPGGAVSFEDRYELLQPLGHGAMGEVRLCFDRTIGREVAMKLIRPEMETSGSRWRFVREARVQGQLEHPSIVPLYDLGVAPDQRLYFTMKRIHGRSLAQILDGLRDGDEATRLRASRRRLLGWFSRACLAVDYMHSRGVVHRDLKPDNIMLGRFGEVYVLDWGLAKLIAATPSSSSRPKMPLMDASGAKNTGEGAVLGTPGYMSPEQLRGEVHDVGPRSDVYSLGTILFELLTLEPLHPRGRLEQKLLSVLQTDGSRPSERSADGDIGEGLDAICVASTRLDPNLRFQSAGALSGAIEAHLDR